MTAIYILKHSLFYIIKLDACIELSLFLLEAKSFRSTFIYYTSICLNGRPNWVIIKIFN